MYILHEPDYTRLGMLTRLLVKPKLSLWRRLWARLKSDHTPQQEYVSESCADRVRKQ